jgi:hypothetical protein
MRHPSHSKLRTRAIHSPILTHPLSQRTRDCPHQHGRSRGPLGTARGGQEQRLLPGRGGLHARAGEALGTFDVARSGERPDEQEWHMHGDGAEGRCGGGERACSALGQSTAVYRKFWQLGEARPSRLVPVALTARNVQYG